MYAFAAVFLIGLAVAKLVDLAGHAIKLQPSVRLLSAFLAGLGVSWATNWSMFYPWMIGFRYAWMGPVATGLVIGGLAAVWHDVLHLIPTARRFDHERQKARFGKAA